MSPIVNNSIGFGRLMFVLYHNLYHLDKAQRLPLVLPLVTSYKAVRCADALRLLAK